MADRSHALESAWPGISGPLGLLNRWDALRGLMLESHDSSAEEAALEVVKWLGANLTLLDSSTSPEAWRATAGDYITGRVAPSQTRAMGKEPLCAVLTAFDQASPRLWSAVKGTMEAAPNPKVRSCIIATVTDGDRVPAEYRSFFHLVRKSGRPRVERE